MIAPDALLCWLWLSEVLGPANPCAGRILNRYQNAQTVWEARSTEEFRAIVGPAAAKRAMERDPESYHEHVMWCDALGVRILTCESPNYPRRFLDIPDRPLILYYTGDAEWLNAPATVGIIGTRRPTSYGIQAAEEIGRGLAKAGAVIVSGLAEGLDSVGHRAAVQEHCPTIGILGIPIDKTYPVLNRSLRTKIEENGCVLSEYPPQGKVPGKYGFLQRNRLIAALSAVVIVVEAREKSGTMSTVSHAERYGKPVFAVPGSIYSPDSAGTNALLREGRARAVCRAEDLFETLQLRPSPVQTNVPRPAPAALSETERRVLACIGPNAKGMEELGAESGLPTAALAVTLMKLELSGRVICLPGKRYILR